MTCAGFPHSDTAGSKHVCCSPTHFAADRALHRLFAPRHPPYALCSLTKTLTFQDFGMLQLSMNTCQEQKPPALHRQTLSSMRYSRILIMLTLDHYRLVNCKLFSRRLRTDPLRRRAVDPMSAALASQKGKTDRLPPRNSSRSASVPIGRYKALIWVIVIVNMNPLKAP